VSCSLPVGTLAPGCPMVLEPVCEWSNWGVTGFECECDLDAAMINLDFLEYIDVVLGDAFASEGRLLRVENEAACASTGNGWYYDDPVHPTSIRVCPNACECAQEAGQHFSLMGGCWGNAAPGMVDAEIPCPRCAETRPKSCASPTGGWGYSIVQCEFSAANPSIPGWSIDPATTNLKYVQHGATAGVDEPWDGYLTYVPSLADCDSVEEGWTFDLSTTPPTVQVCPSACSCAKVKGAVLMIENGCPRHEAAL
jgi:hypothetical protein